MRCRIISVLTFFLFNVFSQASAGDLSSCADDLDRLKRASNDASYKASEANSKSDDFDSCRRGSPSDQYGQDECNRKSNDYRSALNDLKASWTQWTAAYAQFVGHVVTT